MVCELALADEADVLPEPLDVEVADGVPVEEDAAGAVVVEPLQQRDNGRLA